MILLDQQQMEMANTLIEKDYVLSGALLFLLVGLAIFCYILVKKVLEIIENNTSAMRDIHHDNLRKLERDRDIDEKLGQIDRLLIKYENKMEAMQINLKAIAEKL